ncbi:MAG: methyltransferase family protein [Thermoplasmata archaeon]
MGAIVALIIVGLIQFQQVLASVYLYLGFASATLGQIMLAGLPAEIWDPRNLYMWGIVALNILLVSLFLVLVPLRVRGSWRSHGAYMGFFVSLFAEMFGFPLTVFLFVSLGNVFFEPLFVGYVFAFGQVIGSPIVVAGLIFLIKGWSAISFHREEVLVTGRIYRLVRHPQYLGLILITLGSFIVWPTIPTAIMWPVLVFLYYKQAKKEEAYLLEKYGEAFMEYERKVPGFLPRIRRRPGPSGRPSP